MSTQNLVVRLAVLTVALASIFALAVTQSAASRPTGASAKHGACIKHPKRRRCLAAVRHARSSSRSGDTTLPTVSWKPRPPARR